MVCKHDDCQLENVVKLYLRAGRLFYIFLFSESLEDRIEYHAKRRKYEQEALASQNNMTTVNQGQTSEKESNLSKNTTKKSNHSESGALNVNGSDKITNL